MATHETDVAWAASDRDMYILQLVGVISETDADTTLGPDDIGVATTEGLDVKAVGKVTVRYADLFIAVGVIDTAPP